MLSGEERWKTTIPTAERWKTTICLSSKKATCRCSTLFLYISLSLFCTTTTWNFQKRLSYTRSRLLHGGNIVRVLVHFFFFTAVYFHLALVACSFSYFLTAATKLSCCSSNKKMSPFLFISHSKSLSPLFSLGFAGLPSSFFFVSIFLLLYFPNLWTWQLN